MKNLILFLIVLISLGVNGQTSSNTYVESSSTPSSIKSYQGPIIDNTKCDIKLPVVYLLLNDSIECRDVVMYQRSSYGKPLIQEKITFTIKKELLSKDDIIYLFESGWSMDGKFMTESYYIKIDVSHWEIYGNYPKIKFKCEMRCVE